MNRKMIVCMLLRVALICGVMLALPAVVSLIYKERQAAAAFAITSAASVAVGCLSFVLKPADKAIYAREGFLIVALSWVVVSVVGAVPFVASGATNSYIDALFETVSGFTTTGASVFSGAEIEAMPKGLLFWRSFTHWVGGIGVLVFLIAIVGSSTDRPIHVLRAEMPGPVVDKLVPKSRNTVRLLCLIYVGLSAVMTVMLLCGGMSLFDSLVHTFGTAGTGGFAIKADGVAGYNHYIQWVITVFMLIFAVNFNVYYLILIGKVKSALKSTELWAFVGIVVVSIAAIAANIYPIYNSVADCLRLAGFQVASIVSTTGFTTVDYAQWGGLSQTVLFALMFMGGCAGSTAGGLKTIRVVLLFKSGAREVKRILRPRDASVVRLDGNVVDEDTVKGVCRYFVVYALATIVLFVLLGFDPAAGSVETNFSAVVSCFNNVGPAFGTAGPAFSYGFYGVFGKIVLTFTMLLGRLEIYPLLMLFVPATYRK